MGEPLGNVSSRRLTWGGFNLESLLKAMLKMIDCMGLGKDTGGSVSKPQEELEMVAGGQKWRNGCDNHLGGINLWHWWLLELGFACEFDSQNSGLGHYGRWDCYLGEGKDVVKHKLFAYLVCWLIDWLYLINFLRRVMLISCKQSY